MEKKRRLSSVIVILLLCVGCASPTRFTGSKERATSKATAEKQVPRRPPAAKRPPEKNVDHTPPQTVEASLLPIPQIFPKKPSFRQTGMATYYARKFHGRRTASGERYDMSKLTAAHHTLPFGTRVRVTNISNGRSVIVRINDRGPHTKRRIIDLSFAAARKVGLIGPGVAEVVVETVE